MIMHNFLLTLMLFPMLCFATVEIVIIGDSIATSSPQNSAYNWPAALQNMYQEEGVDIKIVNRSLPCTSTVHGPLQLHYLLEDRHPDFVFIALGFNDYMGQVSLSLIRKNITKMIETALENEIPLILGLSHYHAFAHPQAVDNGLKYEEVMINLATKHNLLIIPYLTEDYFNHTADLAYDIIHPNKAGNFFIARNLKKHLDKILQISH